MAGRVHIPEPLVWRLEYGVGPDPIGWGVLSGPHPSASDDLGREIDGPLGNWDLPGTAAQHGVNDFTLRLAAYDPAVMDYPVAVSEAAYVVLETPTVTPTPSATATVAATPTAGATPSLTPSPTVEVAPAATVAVTPEATATPTPEPPPAVTPPAVTPPAVTPPAVTPPAETPSAVRAIITRPEEGTQVTGPVEVQGVADGSGFAGYIVEYAPGDAPQDAEWRPAAPPSGLPVSGGTLALWPTDQLTPGIYSLRLRVFDQSGTGGAVRVRVNVVR